MIVDFQVAATVDQEIEQTMLGEQLQHVIEKRETAADRRFARTIEVQLNAHIGLFRLATNFSQPRCSLGRFHRLSSSQISFSAAISLSFSSDVPTLTRK